MKPIQMQRVFVAVVFTLLVSPYALAAIPDLGDSYAFLHSTFLPGYGTGVADVDSQVFKSASSDDYIYTYIISGSQVNLSFFSVELFPDAGVYEWDVDGAVNTPAVWDLVNDPPESIEALFLDPIEPGEVSATLWFKSPYAPTTADGALSGITGGSYNFLVGDVLTPAPEPATWMLLVSGGMLNCFSRRRK